MKKYFLLLATSLLLLAACKGKEPAPTPDPTPSGDTYKVAMVFPRDEWPSIRKATDWALENMPGLPLSLEWIDETAPDMAARVREVTHDASYAAIIGPEYSSSARLVAKESLSYRIPVLMPTVTSSEFQRIYSESNKRDPNIFCMAQDDIAQCDAVLNKARKLGAEYLFILSRDGKTDDYAASFQQFFAFLAVEYGLYVDTNLIYELPEDIDMMMQACFNIEGADFSNCLLLFVPSSTEDMLAFDKAVQRIDKPLPIIYCADVAHEPSLEGKLTGGPYNGFSLGAVEGFPEAWKARYGSTLPGGYAQMYDCVYMLGAAITMIQNGQAKNVREALQGLFSAWKDGLPMPVWTREGMEEALESAKNNELYNIRGASGTLHFVEGSLIAQEETIYQEWRYENGKYALLDSYKYSDIYQWEDNPPSQIIDYEDIQTDWPYFPLTGHFAILIATSTGWNNYRHQADVLAMYQTLKEVGYTDDNIILILEDDLAGHPSNPHPGEVRITPEGEDVRKGAVIDYKLSTLTPEDFENIMLGLVTERTPVVLPNPPAEGMSGTNVFFFWSGHGARDGVLKWGDGTVEVEQFKNFFDFAEGRYRKMLAVMETCYSGSMARKVNEVGVLFLCASLPGETSHADVYDDTYGTYLSNGFTRAFRETWLGSRYISIHDLYVQLASRTTGSHACIYNSEHYGSIYKNTMEEYLALPVN